MFSYFFSFSDILSSQLTSGGAEDDDFNPRADEVQTINASSTTRSSTNGSCADHEEEDDFDPRAEEKKPPSFTNMPTPELNGFSSPPALGNYQMFIGDFVENDICVYYSTMRI